MGNAVIGSVYRYIAEMNCARIERADTSLLWVPIDEVDVCRCVRNICSNVAQERKDLSLV